MIHPTKSQRLVPFIAVCVALLVLTGTVHAASVVLGYGGTTSTNGAGVYPVQASGNSERYFRCILSVANTEVLTQLWITGVNGTTQLYPKPNGNWNDASDGVTRYLISGGTTSVWAYTIGPFVGRDIYGAQHSPTQSIGMVNGWVGGEDWQFTFYATTVPTAGGTATTVNSGTGTYRTQSDNGCILDWWSGSASGVDPISVDGPVAGADYGSSSNAYTFRVQYRILPTNGCNLLPRFGTGSAPPGPEGNYANFDGGKANATIQMDAEYDFWTYSGGLVANSSPTGDYSDQYPRYDDFGDTSGFWRGNTAPEVVLIIDGDRTRPHMMLRDDPTDADAKDSAGIRYYYKLLPTDYANFMDQLFMFSYDPPGPDPQDAYQSNVHGRPVSNNYVSMQSGGHTYEFLASSDFSPPDGNRVWLNVGRPGHSEENQYMRPIIGGGGQMEVTQVQTRFNDTDGASGGYGYPYDSQSGNYPLVNPMLTAHPYFPRGTIMPNQVEGDLTITPLVEPGKAAVSPFKPEPEYDTTLTTIIAGPNPPARVTNDDTILPNFVNIHPDSSVAPFRGGKWTSSSTYTLRTNYWQSANRAPEYIRAMVRKNPATGTPGTWRGYTMEKAVPGDTNYVDGAVYQYLLTPDQMPDGGGPGDYNYYFLASDGKGVASYPNRPAQDPNNGNILDPGDLGVPSQTDGANDYYSFRVNRAPVLSAQAIVDEAGSPFPIGRSGDNFTFRVTYTDPDGELRNAASQGDRPFETSIYLDLFGSELGQSRLMSVQNPTTLIYSTFTAGKFYANDALIGCMLELQDGAAVGTKFWIADNTGNQIVIDPARSVPAGATLTTPTNVGSNRRFRITKWFHGTMNAADATDTNYTDGKVYQWNSATHVVLGPGVHRYYFDFVDDWGSWLYPDDTNVRVEGEKVRFPFTGEFEGPEVLVNTPPQLRDFRFTPHALNGADGTTATPFVFSVTYVDDENNAPAIIRVGIDGSNDAPAIILNMVPDKPSDTVYSDGAVYVTPPVKLTEGAHVFRAQASDGTLRFPDVAADQPFVFSGPHQDETDNTSALKDSAEGPTVAANTAPVLTFPSTDKNEASYPGLDPDTGRQTTEFAYSIIYTDVDQFAGVAGNPPDYVQVYIDNVAHTMTKVTATDNDYTDGALYEFKTTGLSEATPHTYFFVASDGLDRARKPAQGATPARYEGPVVDEPPGPPQSLFAKDALDDNGGQIDLTFNASVDDGGGADDVTEYRIYRSTTAGTYVDEDIATIPATGSPTYVYRDTSAVTNQDYYYVVRAWDGANESVNSNEAGPVKALDTIPPQPPTNVEALDPGLGGTINVAWNLSADDGGGQGDVKEYHVYRSTTKTGFGGAYLTPAVPAGKGTFADTTVAAGTSYYYMVRSFDGANESINSNVTQNAVEATDQQPPIIADLNPANRAVDVPLATTISFTASDSGTGVEQDSLVVVVNGTTIPVSSLTITGLPAKLTVEYQPNFTVADYRKVINVSVTATDRGGQKSAPKVWKFTLTGPATHSISGSILDIDGKPKQGVTVSAGDLSAVTDTAGNYLITGLVKDTYAVTPRLRHVTFSPASQNVTVDADVTGIDFAWAVGFDITGRVVDKKGNGMQGVSLTNGLATTITDSNGWWKMLDVPAGTYNVVPSLPRYVFAPQSRTVAIGPSASGVRFVGSLQTFSVSGAITGVDGSRLASVAVDATSSEGDAQAISNTSGQYTLTGLLPGRWTITPRKANYMFKPASQTLDVAGDVVETNFVGLPVYNVDLPAGLSFIALPIKPEDTSPTSVFGDPSQVPFWRYDPATADWALSNGTWEGLKVLPGRGFFVSPAHATSLAVPGTPVAANQSTSLTLIGPSSGKGDGWNMVGNPYDAPLPWSNVGVTTGSTVRDFAFIYDRASGGYLLITDLPGVGSGTEIPNGRGMWMRALSTQTVPISAVSSTAAARHATWTRSTGEFIVPIVAQAGSLRDGCSRVGVLNYAKAHPEAYQIDNPPAGAGFVDLFFTGQDGRLTTCDIRGEQTETLQYSFAVKTDLQNATVKVSLPDLSQVARDKAITLIDVSTGKRLYARTLSTYSYNSGKGGARQFLLEIAPAGHGGLSVTTAPAQVKGAGVGLTYTLSKAAKVDVTILNLSGRTVRVLASGLQGAAGANTTAWDLRGQTGTRVPAGRYLIRVRAASDDGQQVTAVAPLNVP